VHFRYIFLFPFRSDKETSIRALRLSPAGRIWLLGLRATGSHPHGSAHCSGLELLCSVVGQWDGPGYQALPHHPHRDMLFYA